MDSKRWWIGSLAALLASACGGRAEDGLGQSTDGNPSSTEPGFPTPNDTAPGGSKPATGVGSLQPGNDGIPGSRGPTALAPSSPPLPASSAPTSSAPAPDCVDAQCPSVSYRGASVSGCCQGSGACGALVPLGTSALCLAPDADQLVSSVNSAFAGVKPEAIRLDPSCPSLSIAGTPLPGCCDPTGVCGVSTQGWSRAAAALGLKIPSSCLTPGEAAGLPGFPVATSTAQTSCGAAPR